MSIESRFDVPFIAALALREKQIQQSYRPVIAVHKWFARRPGTLFRGLVLAEFGTGDFCESFYQSNHLPGVRVADPFMGGGTPLIEANRVGCDVDGCDVNPMSAWIVREEIERIDLAAYERAADRLMAALADDVGRYYVTRCPIYGDADVPVKSFLWIKTLHCVRCEGLVDLFPGYMVARDVRHPMNVLVCAACGELNEVTDTERPGTCGSCGEELRVRGPARRGSCACPHCGHENAYPGAAEGAPGHRLFAIEYHNRFRKAEHRGRFFKKPDAEDLRRFEAARRRYEQMNAAFVPDETILAGDETTRLHRWGYAKYRDLFNERQLLGLELSCRRIAGVRDERTRRALATNLSDLLRYQNMLCRYDTMALKALDVFSVHGFPVGLVQCESNLLGIANGRGSNVGSGGWSNIVRKYSKAKAYCERPYEVRREGGRNRRVEIAGEWIGDGPGRLRSVSIQCASGTESELSPKSVDAVFTDPPYFGNVQYGELMDFCYVWLRKLAGKDAAGFRSESTRSPDELTGNETAARGIEEFTEGLSEVWRRMTVALKPGAPLAFTYHHNKLEAYAAVGVAVLDAGLVCTAALPCPAEMGGSIHIHGTRSSIVDTVFVCRERWSADARPVPADGNGMIETAAKDVASVTVAGRRPSLGDARCIVLGHGTRAAIARLRERWDCAASTGQKIRIVRDEISSFGGADELAAQARNEGIEMRRAGEDEAPAENQTEKQVALPV